MGAQFPRTRLALEVALYAFACRTSAERLARTLGKRSGGRFRRRGDPPEGTSENSAGVLEGVEAAYQDHTPLTVLRDAVRAVQ